jgi:hypothetical protein
VKKQQTIKTLQTLASTFEAITALLPEGLYFDMEQGRDGDITIRVFGPDCRKFVRSLGGRAEKWYAEGQQRDIVADLGTVTVQAYERRHDIEMDKMKRGQR